MKKALLQWSVVLGVFAALVYYVAARGSDELLPALKEADLGYLAPVALLEFLFLLTNGMILKTLLASFNVRISLREGLGISAATAMFNYLTMFGGGTLGKALYLKRRHEFPYHAFVATASAAHAVDVIILSMLGCSMAVLTGLIVREWGNAVFSVFVSVGIISCVLVLFPPKFIDSTRKVLRFAAETAQGWRRIRGDGSLLLGVALLLLANHLLAATELLAGYGVLLVKISMPEAVLLGAVAGLSSVARLTPANMGIQEVAIAVSSHILGIGFDKGLLVAALLRGVSLVVVFSCGSLFGLSVLRGKR